MSLDKEVTTAFHLITQHKEVTSYVERQMINYLAIEKQLGDNAGIALGALWELDKQNHKTINKYNLTNVYRAAKYCEDYAERLIRIANQLVKAK